ncbi:Spermidine/putrescine ABC transporter ATPase subunit [Sodalis praecaptivus]|uniref:Spermidine/putrescine ABC transporter ATPase subunit n=1 Tax=Sodalis praecaptivus TaxID=1239307 RepID=W0HS62_9GAMM|nr:ABC transporter ATP-binding protein [Sodalis praecaptivus]AHF76619.1 Spermidine/putrescine ABC transporter ATPase subunit [Sodalis praecaptivus]
MQRSVEVCLTHLTKHYGSTVAVDDLSLTVPAGEILVLLGPSGCGKTTCLRMVAGLDTPTRGDIRVDGRSIARTAVHQRNVGMLLQNYALFPHLTVAENIAFGLKMRGLSRADISDKVNAALDRVRLAHLHDRLPEQLSGGQQQRVSLARALVIEPDILLLDEPLGALDKGLRESLQWEIRQLQQRLGLTTLLVTHDQDEALTLADTIAVMHNGRLEQCARAADIYQKPATAFVAGFLGASNFLTARVVARGADHVQLAADAGLTLTVAACPSEAQRVTVTLRPEAIRLAPLPSPAPIGEANSATGRIAQVVYRGYMLHFYVTLDGGTQMQVWMQSSGDGAPPAFQVGEPVMLRWPRESNHVLPA